MADELWSIWYNGSSKKSKDNARRIRRAFLVVRQK
jgi:hypothetical protein